MSHLTQVCNEMHGAQQVLQQLNRIERHSRLNPGKARPEIDDLRRARRVHGGHLAVCSLVLSAHPASNEPDYRAVVVDQEAVS